MQQDTHKGKPQHVVVQMLKKVYSDLEQKDMPEDQFVRQAMAVIKDKKTKKSPLILPN